MAYHQPLPLSYGDHPFVADHGNAHHTYNNQQTPVSKTTTMHYRVKHTAPCKKWWPHFQIENNHIQSVNIQTFFNCKVGHLPEDYYSRKQNKLAKVFHNCEGKCSFTEEKSLDLIVIKSAII